MSHIPRTRLDIDKMAEMINREVNGKIKAVKRYLKHKEKEIQLKQGPVLNDRLSQLIGRSGWSVRVQLQLVPPRG